MWCVCEVDGKSIGGVVDFFVGVCIVLVDCIDCWCGCWCVMVVV